MCKTILTQSGMMKNIVLLEFIMEVPATSTELIQMIEEFGQDTLPTLLAIIAIAGYSAFVYLFYRQLARRDLLTLDLSKYESTMTGRIKGFFRTFIFLVQYVIAIPTLIAFWTLVMAVILTLLSEGTDHSRNAMIATSVVGAVRIVSYWTEDLSRDVAKMLPFAVLGVFLVGSTSVKISEFEELYQNIPQLAESYVNSLILLSILETILRIIYTLTHLRSTSKRVNRKLKDIAVATGRGIEEIKEDLLDDGILNQSVEPKGEEVADSE